MKMRAVCLREPWLWLMLDLPPEFIKDCENRDRRLTKELGPILVKSSCRKGVKHGVDLDVQYYNEVPLCDGCWGEGENDSAWDDRITQRIRDRRAGIKPKQSIFSVLCTVKVTWSLRGIKAEDEDAAIAKVKAMEAAELERNGHEIDYDLDIDSVEREHLPIPVKKKARKR